MVVSVCYRHSYCIIDIVIVLLTWLLTIKFLLTWVLMIKLLLTWLLVILDKVINC